jgi:hypothetical protein
MVYRNRIMNQVELRIAEEADAFLLSPLAGRFAAKLRTPKLGTTPKF